MNDFVIQETLGNKSGSIPAHWDIFVKGQDDSIITCWDSKAMAEACVKFLEQYVQKKD